MNKRTDRELLQYLFYMRIDLLGLKLEEVIAESEPELWREIYSRVTKDKYLVTDLED